jgi:glycyl-tRNA synthetase beta chain
MKDFLLEIGTEELPAGYIDPALKALSAALTKMLTEHRIAFDSARTFGTPRRLAVLVTNVADKQTSVTEEVLGPPEKIALDADGTPRVPAVKFAEKIGISPKQLFVKQTDKGGYVAATLTRKGIVTKKVLASVLPKIILSLSFPKRMRWSDLSVDFARPIQSVLSILGTKVVGFQLANLKSGRRTVGHRFMAPKKIKIQSPDQYIDKLKEAFVMADVEKRKALIQKEIIRAATTINGEVLPDAELLDVVTNLVEYPAVCVGTFDEKFLALPDEILITAMREHQKYFAVTDGKRLLPNFIVVNNTPANDMNLVAKGHERVLRARLEDAMFFYLNDVADSLDKNVEKLKGVLFQADLGSMYDKTLRVSDLAAAIADLVSGESGENDYGVVKDHVIKAARLCKADLVSQVVVEFPKLQGVIGRIYAAGEKEPKDVAAAIEEHYRPTFSGGTLPKTVTGAIIGIADKLDTICGCFAAGLIPSGASDPYALRRQGIGIVQIILDRQLGLSLMHMIKTSLGLYFSGDREKIDDTANRVYRFIKDRISNMMAEEGFAKDVIAAVCEISVDGVVDAWKRVAALQELKQAPDYEPLAIAFKRVVNIINKSVPKKSGLNILDLTSAKVDTGLFEEKCESDLHAAFTEVDRRVAAQLSAGGFDEALRIISTLREPVDVFFEGVMVMAESEDIRNNRLALLGGIAALFETIADFSKLST